MAIRVVLELVGGNQKRRKVPLGPNQQLTVGRSPVSDFAVEDDSALGGTHFVLTTDAERCRIVNQDNQQGTLVNDNKVDGAELKNGDRIKAGYSEFSVHIDGAAPPVVSASTARPAMAGATARPAPPPVALSWQKCNTGLLVCREQGEKLPAADIAERLATLFPMWLIVDWKALGMEPPAEVGEADVLFDWLPPEAARYSPCLVGQAEIPNCRELLEHGWGKNGLVCLFSRQPKTELVEHWRKLIRSHRDAILGVCWPGVLGPLLEHFRADLAATLMQGSPALLLEQIPPPGAWQIFSTSPPNDQLKALGFGVEAAANSASKTEAA